jgi:hypothetical protein
MLHSAGQCNTPSVLVMIVPNPVLFLSGINFFRFPILQAGSRTLDPVRIDLLVRYLLNP